MKESQPKEPLKELTRTHQSEILTDESTKTQTTAVDFWHSIQNVLRLQSQAPPLLSKNNKVDLPLSFAEEHLWWLCQLQPESAVYNLPFALRLQGEVNLTALEQSFNEILRRHEVLRSIFVPEKDTTIRKIDESLNFQLTVIDLRNSQIANRENHALQLLVQDAQLPFDLAKAPLFRVLLLQLDQQDYILLIIFHHLVFDGWSEGIFFRELASIYQDCLNSVPSSLPELPIQYADFAIWQRQWMQGEVLNVLLDYWQKQLSLLPQQHLPFDHPHPTLPTHRSERQVFTLSGTLTASLKSLSRQAKVTLFTILLSAFCLLLHCYTGQVDLLICTPAANRNRSELKALIGYFANTLLMRVNLSGDPGFRNLLIRVQQVVSGAYAHQDLPIQKLLKTLNLGTQKLSQVMFVLQNTPRQALQLSGLEVNQLDLDNGIADFDLFVSLTEESGTLVGTLKYNTDLFKSTTIHTFLQHFQTLLENIVVYPDVPLSSPLLLNAEIVRNFTSSPLSSTLTQGDRTYIPPRDQTEFQLTLIWEQVLEVRPISIQANFFELGGHSMLALRLFTLIKQTFGKDLPLPTLFQAPTVEKLAQLIKEHLEGSSGAWSALVPLQPYGSHHPIFCVHGIGGNVIDLYKLAHHLGPDYPFYGIQALGVDGSHQPLNSIKAMASLYIEEIRKVQPEGPYFLAGNSMGGVVAFEMAQQLFQQNQKVGLLAFLDTYGPIYYQPITFSRTIMCHLRNLITLPLQKKFNYLYGVVIRILFNRFKDLIKHIYFKAKHYSHNPTNDSIFDQAFMTDEQYKVIKAIHDAHKQALLNYKPKKYPDQITLFRVSQQQWWSMHDMYLGWNGLANKGITVCEVSGNHNNMLYGNNVALIAEKLKMVLSNASK